MVTEPLNATELIGLLKFSELRKEKPKKYYVQGNTDAGWRGGQVIEWMDSFVRVKNETSEFIMPAANLCRLHKEDLTSKNPLDTLNKIS